MTAEQKDDTKSLNTYGPQIILNGGTASLIHITTPDRYSKYSMYYTMGVANKTWLALKKVINDMVKYSNKGVMPARVPWKIDEADGWVHLRLTSIQKVPVMDNTKAVVPPSTLSENMGLRASVKPMFYSKKETVVYNLPDGTQGHNVVVNAGISVYVNGIMINKGEDDEF